MQPTTARLRSTRLVASALIKRDVVFLPLNPRDKSALIQRWIRSVVTLQQLKGFITVFRKLVADHEANQDIQEFFENAIDDRVATFPDVVPVLKIPEPHPSWGPFCSDFNNIDRPTLRRVVLSPETIVEKGTHRLKFVDLDTKSVIQLSLHTLEVEDSVPLANDWKLLEASDDPFRKQLSQIMNTYMRARFPMVDRGVAVTIDPLDPNLYRITCVCTYWSSPWHASWTSQWAYQKTTEEVSGKACVRMHMNETNGVVAFAYERRIKPTVVGQQLEDIRNCVLSADDLIQRRLHRWLTLNLVPVRNPSSVLASEILQAFHSNQSVLPNSGNAAVLG